MTENPDRKPSLILPVAALALLLLLAGYVGLYLKMAYSSGRDDPDVTYAFDGRDFKPRTDRGARVIFAPIHWLDRRIRPHFWE